MECSEYVRLKARAAELEARHPQCQWICTDDSSWITRCGNAFTIIEGTPEDNSMKFCCYCGGDLAAKPTGEA